MKKSLKKTISYLLILCLLMQTCFVGFAFGETASVNQQIDIAGTKIDVNQDLRENADGTYTLSIELASEINRVAKSEDHDFSKNEYFTAKVAGKYLIELWGGDGADGSNTSYGQGGKGGLGGHIYGVVDLKVGQTLYYVIGGDGVQTVATDDGGGANGDGGHHGDIGSVAVGGGGGYSAVFLFDEGEFEAKYLDQNGQMKFDNIDEDDRTSKYIMIAAGGGGGGGGNGFSFGGTQSGRADGGAGGSIGSSSGVLENGNGIEYDVEGTFYAGENGKSSGTSYEYIGHGATNNPGVIADTFTTLLKGKQPNDWKGTYNRDFLGGGGGGGNFRGGAGGAGFCGGSGGIQTSILIPTNVGGGGGGSSFMAKIVEPAPAGFVPEHAKNDSTQGGMVSIEFLGTTTDLVLNDLNLSLDVSKYFDITGVTEGGVNKAHTLAGQKLSVNDIDLGTNGEPKTIEITFKPKEGFAGGNMVPLLNSNEVKFSHAKGSTTLATKEETSYVNVPLNFEVIGKSYMTKEIKEYPLSDLYTDNYAGVRDNLSTNWEYDFIQSIGNCQVIGSTGATVKPTVTTQYPIRMTVTPKTGNAAVVGTPVETTTFEALSIITILEEDEITLNGEKLNYTKTLNYDAVSNTFNLALNVNGTSELVDVEPIKKTTSQTFTIERSGYYMIQAWGGNGGNGDDASAWGRDYEGGSGNEGKYVKGYIYLNKGDQVSLVVGANGSDGESGNPGTAAIGGQYTAVIINSGYVLIAGGGGAGGNAGVGGIGLTSKEGNPAVERNSIGSTLEDSFNVYNGENGGLAKYNNISSCTAGGAGGQDGLSFRHATLVKTDASGLKTDKAKTTFGNAKDDDYADATQSSNGGGAVYLTFLEDETQNTTNQYKKYSLDVQISDYFNIIQSGITLDNVGTGTGENYGINVTGKTVTITNINPKITETTEGLTTTKSIDFTVTIPVKVIDGFLGGNDVPLLTSMVLGQEGVEGYAIPAQDESDWANLPITDTPALETYDQTYVIGTSPGVFTSDLYTWANEPNLSVPLVADFVEKKAPTQTEYKPNVTTPVDITVGLVPKTESTKAVVQNANPIGGTSVTKPATIYVNYNATYNLTNMTTSDTPYVDNIYAVDPNTAYEVTLSPASGYLLPETITVTIGGAAVDSSKYTYDNETGELTIPKELINGNIVITATGEIVTYSLNFIYEIRPGFGQYTKTEKYPAGTAIDAAATFAGTYVPPAYDGYTFIWNWATDDGNPITQMPAQNWWVTGQYVANDYNLTINYYKGNELHSTHTETIKYGNEYNITSPTISGYVPDKTIVEGTMPARDVTIDVNYTATANQLNIIYIMADTNEEVDRYVGSYDTDAFYRVETPLKDGYTADIETVSGTMTAEGKVVYVYYTPNKYTVTFNPDGGNMIESQKTKVVAYNNTYGYDASTGNYTPLPEPVKIGYTFDGWYHGGQKITEETKVNALVDHQLVAKWKSDQYTVTVKYVYEDGTKALDDYSKSFDYNTAYDIKSPSIEGYTPDVDRVQGTIGAQNVVVTVKYVAKEYKLTINYVYAKDDSEASPTVTKIVPYNEEYSITSPTVAKHTASVAVVEGIMPATDKTITVYYYENAPTINVTVEWGDLTFEYERGDWNTETLQYGEDVITPTSAGNNTVTVINKDTSTVPVIADLKYIGDTQYRNLGGYFTANNNKADAKISETTVAKGSQKTSYLWLEGNLERDVTGTITSGTCEVTIRGGK